VKTTYSRLVTVSIPADIDPKARGEIYAKAAELNASFADDAYSSKRAATEGAARAIHNRAPEISACLVARALSSAARRRVEDNHATTLARIARITR